MTNSLLTRYPTLAAELDMVENGGLQAGNVHLCSECNDQIIYTSRKPYVWKCKYNHLYKMTIQQRVKYMESTGERSEVRRRQ